MANDDELKAMGIKNNNTYTKNNTNHTNTVAITIKVLSVINAIIGVILGLIGLEDFEEYAIGFIVVILISSLFTYAVGEIIQKLQNIEDNTRK